MKRHSYLRLKTYALSVPSGNDVWQQFQAWTFKLLQSVQPSCAPEFCLEMGSVDPRKASWDTPKGMAGLNSPHCSAHFIAFHCVSHIVLTPWHWRLFCPVLAVRQLAASTCNLHWVSVKVPWYLKQRMLRLLTPEDTVMIALVLSSGNFCLPWLLTSQWFFKIQSFEVNLSEIPCCA